LEPKGRAVRVLIVEERLLAEAVADEDEDRIGD
jgi:hypothetical protein